MYTYILYYLADITYIHRLHYYAIKKGYIDIDET